MTIFQDTVDATAFAWVSLDKARQAMLEKAKPTITASVECKGVHSLENIGRLTRAARKLGATKAALITVHPTEGAKISWQPE